MISPPPIARRTSRIQRSVTEFGSADHVALQASGLHQGATVNDRVRHWQAHGAASAPPPDAVSVLSIPRSDVSDTPDQNEPEKVHEEDRKYKQSRQEQRRARPTTQDRADTYRIRSASTPRKRIVSDEHWKAKRAPKQDRYVVPTTDRDPEHRVGAEDVFQARSPRTIKETRAEREERRRRRVEARSRKVQEDEGTPIDDLLARDNSRPAPSSVAEEPLLDQVAFSNGLEDEAHEDSRTVRDGSPLEFDEPIFDDDDDAPRQKSKYAETLGRPPSAYQDVLPRSKKRILLNKTKEVLGVAEPIPMMSNRLPSIEAWLDDQPGPFVEAISPRALVTEEKPRAKKQNSMKRSASEKHPAPLDPNKIWESIGTYTEISQPSADLHDDEPPTVHTSVVMNELEPASPVSLKRQSAKASRLKRRTLRQGSPEVTQLLSGNGDNERGSPQLDGERPCPQSSPTKLSTIVSVETLREPNLSLEEVPESPVPGTNAKILNDEDMMTVLSQTSLRRSSKRKRSVKPVNNQQKADQTKQILETLAQEQAKYCRELRTLVDGVIPVLLQCVLSKTDAVAAAGLFTTSASLTHDLSFNRPIIDMGVALERLKSLHNRMPTQNMDHLFSWCQSAHKAYSDYLKAWRLGFQDVVVNLAPLDGSDGESSEVMARNANGDIVNSDGQTVDIAYLMKRPLVNIRKIGRVLSCLHEEMPDNPAAEKAADQFRELTAAAKTKHQQEQGRIEDEVAASVDATKCRDIRSLGPLLGATVDKNKRVRAKDYFDMTLFHSTGQRMDCKIELTMRDNQRPSPEGGDLLICQIDEAAKWLLFAPTDLGSVSARKGESGCDLVVMLRGRAGLGQEWRELLALKAEEPEVVSEWMMMLGSNPLPPKLDRVPSFVDMKDEEPISIIRGSADSRTPRLARVPSTETIDVPIGEPSVLGVVTSQDERPLPPPKVLPTEKPLPKLSMGGGLQTKPIPEHWQIQNPTVARKPVPASVLSSDRSTISGYSTSSISTYTPSSLAPLSHAGSSQDSGRAEPAQVGHQRSKSQGFLLPEKMPTERGKESISASTHVAEGSSQAVTAHSKNSEPKKDERSLLPSENLAKITDQSRHRRAVSSAPSQVSPNVPKVRTNSSSNTPLTESIRETWSSLSGFSRKIVSQPISPVPKSTPESKTLNDKDDRNLVPRKGEASRQENLKVHTSTAKAEIVGEIPPPPPQHKQTPVLGPRSRNVPTLRPSEAQKRIEKEKGILPYSPLRKHYTPSSASDSENSGSELSLSDEDDSQTSEELEDEPQKHPKSKSNATGRRQLQIPVAYPRSVPTSGTRTVAPSDSASQGPYRRVPASAERPQAVKKRAIAMICSWNEKGLWDPLVEDYCSIVISPGLMEAFVMSEAHSGASDPNQRPLAAFELTPMVPLRKGTGLDINIRSPPTPNSQIQTSSNILFRSRNAMECESLYQMINWARCNNQTYIELERSRPRPQPTVTFSNEQAPRPRSWFSFGSGMKRRNSYRVGNIPPSSMGESQTTTNTASSAMSALKRLTKSSAFNVDRSSVIRKPGTGTDGSLYSSSNGGVDSNGNTPPPSQLGFIPGKDGPNAPPTSAAAVNGAGMVHNMRIRLQVRKSQGWVTMGFSRLTILPAVKRSDDSPEVSRPDSSGSNSGGAGESSRRASTTTGSAVPSQRQYRLPSSSHTPIRLHGGGREKRVVVTWEKDPNQILLDATLGESCFEKISHLGIAVQVWQPEEEVRSRGGVCIGRNTKFLFQFFSAKECAWVFELVGRYRYGDALTE